MTEYDSLQMYYRFLKYLNVDEYYTLGISYESFRTSYCFFVYTLSSNQGQYFGLLNAVKSGLLRAYVDFSKPTFYPLYMVLYSEINETLSISKKGHITQSYVGFPFN